MRNKIRKKVVFTKIECSAILVENEQIITKELEAIEEVGDYSSFSKAEKVARKHYKGMNIVVTKIDTRQQIHEMDLKTFIENSQIIEKIEQLEMHLGGE